MYILQKTRSNLVNFGLGSLISDLQTAIGGHHPVLYFTTQITEKYSAAMCYVKPNAMHMGELSEFLTYIKFHPNSSFVLCAWIECIHHNILKKTGCLGKWGGFDM